MGRSIVELASLGGCTRSWTGDAKKLSDANTMFTEMSLARC